MKLNSSKKSSSKSGGRSSSHRSGLESDSGSHRGPTSSSRNTNAEVQEGANLPQWGPWLTDQYGRAYRERELPNGAWEYDIPVNEAPNVPRTKPDSTIVDAEQDQGSHADDFEDDDSFSYKFDQKYETSTRPGVTASPGSSLATIPERFSNLHMGATLKYNLPQTGSMVDESGIPIGQGVAPYQAQPIGRVGFTQEGFQSDDAKGFNDDRQSHISPAPSRKISGHTGGAGEQAGGKAAALDANYKVHPAKDFKFGHVFKIYWSEPKGQGGNRNNGDGTEGYEIKLNYGELCYATIRRFIIARVNDGHCLCLPILTYGYQATTKKGVKPQDHAIIYTAEEKKGKSKPVELDGEVNLQKSPIRIIPRTKRDTLDPLSRLNYSKIYTVEYNVKVCFVGQIHDKSVKYFLRDYNLTHAPLPENPNTEYSDEEPQQVRRRVSDVTSYEKDQSGGKQRRN